ncbi:MAG: radical SAM protein [Dehalococcoidia bacterium]|nr:MAG: radical SAM protein [Dehalococcoidia bacterium]
MENSPGMDEMLPRVREVEVKSVLTRSRLFPYCVNPYRGCAHACVYCYARFATRFSHPHEAWGGYVDVRVNAPEVLERQLTKAKPATVYMSSVCDAWQPLEERYGVSRTCLELLVGAGFPLFLQTKSTLVNRDLDVLAGRPNISLGVTITTVDRAAAALFEPGAALPSDRLQVVRNARAQGLSTFVFVGPLLPGVSDGGEGLRAVFESVAAVQPDRLFVDRLNRRTGMWPDVRAAVSALDVDLVPEYQRILFSQQPREYESLLRKRVSDVATAHGLLDRIEWCF